jgi:hypothetical protein
VNVEEFVRRVRAILEVAGIPYMLTGSLASSIHGIPRATNDIDFVVAPNKAQLLELLQRCKRLGFYVSPEEATAALQNKSQFSVIDFATSWKADLIICKTRAFSVTEFERRAEIELGDLRLTVATPEDVLIAKLEWAKMGESEQQLIDAAGILRIQGEALDAVYVERWVESLGLQAQWAAAREKAG